MSNRNMTTLKLKSAKKVFLFCHKYHYNFKEIQWSVTIDNFYLDQFEYSFVFLFKLLFWE